MSVDKLYYHNIDLASNELKNGRIYNLTTTQRVALGTQLTSNSKGYIVYDITLLALYLWNGSAWVTSSGGGGGTVTSVSAGTGMNFTTITSSGSIDIDTTKVPYIAAGFSAGFLKWSTSSSSWVFDNNTYALASQLSNYVPTSRTLTINGVTYDLSADRSWTISSSGGILHATASGTDTYTVTLPAVTSYADGDAYLIRFTNGNTTSCTIAFNSLATVPLYRNNDGPLIGGDIAAGSEMLLVYNSTLVAFQCIGVSPNTLLAYVTNAEATTITKGQAVYAYGGTGDRMTVKLAYNTTDATSAQTVGIVLSTSIAANQKGLVIMQGLIDGLSLFPTSSWNDGDPVYLGATAGSLTKTKPYAPNHLVYLGVVTTASPGSAGRMYVRVQNGYELDELHNVSAQSPTNNDGIFYNSSTQLWEKKSIPTALGYTPENTANKGVANGYAPLDGGGKIPTSNLPSTLLVYKGVWNASTNNPTLTNNDVTKAGFVYNVSVAGTQFSINWSLGDWLIYNDLGVIEKSDNSDDVVSVNGQQGVVVLTAANVGAEPAFTTLPISKGGTNSGTTLNNNRVMQSSGGAIVEAVAITAARALKSDANGIPTHFDTTTEPSLTELAYVKGVTSAIQTQLNAKASKTQVDYINGIIEIPSNTTYTLVLRIPFGGTITETTTISSSGTCTATWQVNTTSLANTNAVSSVLDVQSQSQSFSANDSIKLVVSSNSSCQTLQFTIKYSITLQ